MISNSDDIIDSRDVIEELETMVCETPEDFAHYADLMELNRQGENNSEDWQYGATLIRDSYFVTYAQELADDIGAVDSDAGWPMSCIDWEKAARELRMDYSSVEFDGVTYWVR